MVENILEYWRGAGWLMVKSVFMSMIVTSSTRWIEKNIADSSSNEVFWIFENVMMWAVLLELCDQERIE